MKEDWIGLTPFVEGAGNPSQIKVTCLRWKDGEKLIQIPMAFWKEKVSDWEQMEYFRMMVSVTLLALAARLGMIEKEAQSDPR